MKIDLTKSLNQLDGVSPATPAINTHVVTESHRLRELPLSQLTVEDLRLLIGQEIGLDHLVPLALARLEEHPLASGDFYPGDLLIALLRISPRFWQARRDWRRRVEQIAPTCGGAPDEHEPSQTAEHFTHARRAEIGICSFASFERATA